ncbi:hypothetical protein WMF38_04685 [Sorangium sp. So ce118]
MDGHGPELAEVRLDLRGRAVAGEAAELASSSVSTLLIVSIVTQIDQRQHRCAFLIVRLNQTPGMPHPDQPLTNDEEEEALLDEEEEDLLDRASMATLYAVGYIGILADAIERGDADLQMDSVAWENTLIAVEGAMVEQIRGRLHGPTAITAEDVERVRRLRELGSAALSGGERSPELCLLALQSMESLFGPDWKRAAREAASYARALNQEFHPGSGT